MPIEPSKVLRGIRPGKEQVRDALAADWSRCFPPSVRGTAADAMGCDRGTLNNGITGEHIPGLHTVLASLLLDKTALQAVMALYGVKIVPLTAEAANDLETVSSLSHLAGQWVHALADGNRNHRETCQLADAIRPLIPALDAIIQDADRIKGAA